MLRRRLGVFVESKMQLHHHLSVFDRALTKGLFLFLRMATGKDGKEEAAEDVS
jgi:hypothetical protein